MSRSSEKSVSLVQATRTLYGVRAPTDDQIGRVFQLMKAGTLAARDGGANRLKWTTTESDLAEFMAQRQLSRARARKDRESPLATEDDRPPSTTGQQDGSAPLQRVYGNIWRDYFLAVMLRRRMNHRSAAFHRAVLIGQVFFLLLLVGALVGSVGKLASLTSAPTEHRAVVNWLEQHTDACVVKHWRSTYPDPDGEGRVVCVEYRYRKDSQRWIHTARTFHVVGGKVTEMQSEDE